MTYSERPNLAAALGLVVSRYLKTGEDMRVTQALAEIRGSVVRRRPAAEVAQRRATRASC